MPPHLGAAVLGGRRLLFIGDSTMQQAAATLANLVEWESADCAGQLYFGGSDTLVHREFGAFNRGPDWTEWVEAYRPDLVVVSAGAHIYNQSNFKEVLNAVADVHLRRFPSIPLLCTH